MLKKKNTRPQSYYTTHAKKKMKKQRDVILYSHASFLIVIRGYIYYIQEARHSSGISMGIIRYKHCHTRYTPLLWQVCSSAIASVVPLCVPLARISHHNRIREQTHTHTHTPRQQRTQCYCTLDGIVAALQNAPLLYDYKHHLEFLSKLFLFYLYVSPRVF